MASAEHERGVATAEQWLRNEGYRVLDLIDIGDSRPDAYGEKPVDGDKVTKAVVEVETCDSLDIEQSQKQMNDFARWAAEHPSRRLALFVPKSCLGAAKSKLPKYKEYVGF